MEYWCKIYLIKCNKNVKSIEFGDRLMMFRM